MLLLVSAIGLGQGYPDCRWNCRSSDVTLTEVYLDGPDSCVEGERVTATLMGVFENGTRASRYDIALLGELVITTSGGSVTTSLEVVSLTSVISPGRQNLPIAEISFPCGAAVELRDLLISWDTKEGGDLSCSSRSAKCSSTARVVIDETPLSANFESSAPACVGETVSFVSRTTGGAPPYSSYLWDFGDGTGSSTNANPSYAYQIAGTFPVSLTVTDGGTSSTISHDVTVLAVSDAAVGNSGPYCTGDTIELFADGGTNYSWTGPGGYTSTKQNPTIPNGAAGVYTVEVSNAAGCSSSASTHVIVDADVPVLSLPADTIVECGGDISPASTGQATAADLTGSSILITYVDDYTSDHCGDGTGTIQRTWTATDVCGHTSSGIQAIVVVDTQAPSLTVSSLTLECDGAGNADEIESWLQSATASDACGDVVVSHDYVGLTESCPGVGEASVSFSAVDSCGNTTQRIVTLRVQDTTPPIAGVDVVTVDASATVLIDALNGDSDTCSGQLSLVSVSAPARGTAVMSGNQVTYIAPDTAGLGSFTYVVEDCSGLQSTGQVNVTVLQVNRPPASNDAAVTTAEDTPVDLTVTASDPDGDVLTYGIVSGPSHGEITGFDPATGRLIYTPDANYHGDDSFTFETCDPDGECASGTVTITVEPVDDQPVADNQEVNTLEDTAIAIQVTGSDVEGEALTYSIVSGPSRGTISGFDETTGVLIYTPEEHYTGTDGFVFDVSDSNDAHGRPQATVTIMVMPVNDAPVANDQIRATSEDTATGFFALAISDPDNTLAELESNFVEAPQHGSIERGPDHTVNYTPNLNYAGADTFTYIVCDPNDLCETATVTVTVSAENDNPALEAENQTTREDTAIDIAVTHSDPDGDTLSCTVSDPAHGSANPREGTIDGPYPRTNVFTYTPDPNFVGVDQVVVQCDDGNGGSDSVTIEITVTSANDRPEANDLAVTMPEDTLATITMTGSDPDLDVLSFKIVGGPSHGTITGLDGATGPDGCGSCHTAASRLVWTTGGVSAGHLTYTPEQDYHGTDEIIYQTCDSSGACDTGVVAITVEPTDDNPIPESQEVTTPEDVAKGIVLTAVEPDGEALTYEIVSEPSHGTITGFDEDTGELIYVPDENFAGRDSFVFEACDPDAEHGCPQATVTVTVTPVNDPPTAQDQSVTTLEGRAVTLILTGSDIDGDALVFSISHDPAFGRISAFDPTTGQPTYIPNGLFSGVDELTFRVCDSGNGCEEATLTIEVLPLNHAPTANDEALTTSEDTPVDLTVTASDPDGDVLTYGIVSGPSHGEITGFDPATGRLIYTPDANYHGDDSFTFETCDPDGECASGTVTITVEPVDDQPVADNQEVNTLEDTAIAIQVTGSDVEGEALTYSIVSGPSRGTISGFDETTGVLIYTPEEHYTGTDGFVFDVSDSNDAHGRPQATVTIMVMPVNDAPVANDQIRATSEDTATGFFALAISDPDNTLAELESNFVEAPQHGSIERGPDHTVNYTPNLNYAGADTFTYIVCDPNDLCETATVTVTVSAENDNPALEAENQTTREDTAIDIAVTHSDPDGDTLSCTVSDPAHGSANPREGTIDGPYPRTNVFTYTPDPNFVGVDQVVVQCDDGNGGSDSVTIEITVTSANDRPEANDLAVTMPEDTLATITMTGSDPDLDVLSFKIVGGPSHGTITGLDGATGPDGCGSCHTAASRLVWTTGGVSAGHLTYTPEQDYHGTDEIIYQTCDSSGACDTGVVAITVEPTDDNPIPESQEVTTPEDVAKGIVLTAVEPDGEALTYEIVSEPSHGTITGFDEDTGELIYVPDENFAGRDSFVFEACDPDAEHGCPQATVTVTVTPVNDPPAAGDQAVLTPEDTPLSGNLPGSDLDDTDLTFTLLSSPDSGIIADFDALTGSFLYIPNGEFAGDDQFMYEICDPSGACDRGTITITVLPVNDEPIARTIRATTEQDTLIAFQLIGTDTESVALDYSLAVPPLHGEFLGWDEVTGEVQYQPDAGFVGNDAFLFRVCDPEGACDTALASVRVIDVNDAPQATYVETSVNQAEPSSITARATDPDGDSLTYSIISDPIHGTITSFDSSTGEIEYVSADGYMGPDLIRFEACDEVGACDVGVIQIEVIPTGGGGVTDACPHVVISEVAWAGTSAGEDDEWIELRNLEEESIDLEGWTLRWRNPLAESPEERAWRTVSLSGVLAGRQVGPQIALNLSESRANSWWVEWANESTGDYLVMERDRRNIVVADSEELVYPARDAFGLSTDLHDAGASIELIGPSGCVADTASLIPEPLPEWPAGSDSPAASMERTDALADDEPDNWHTNLGFVRNSFDAFGNLIHGTPGTFNSPRLDLISVPDGEAATVHPVGEPIVVEIESEAIWSSDLSLWHVTVLQSGEGVQLEAAWSVTQIAGTMVVTIQTNTLPMNVELGVWIRTPTGGVLFAPYLLYPY
ncbi:Ig-like domain-containing protein [Candidatus Bipolaricaulota bacterium]